MITAARIPIRLVSIRKTDFGLELERIPLEVFIADRQGRVYMSWITLADFNGDVVLDMAVTSQGDYADEGAASIIIEKKGGAFNSPVAYGSGKYLRCARSSVIPTVTASWILSCPIMTTWTLWSSSGMATAPFAREPLTRCRPAQA